MKKIILLVAICLALTAQTLFAQVPSFTQIGPTSSYKNIIKRINGNYLASSDSDVYEFTGINATFQGLNFNTQVGVQRGISQMLGENSLGNIFRATFDNGIYQYQNGNWSFNSLSGYGTGGSYWTKLANGRIVMIKGGFLRNIYFSDNDGSTWNLANTGDVDWSYLTVSNTGNLFAVSPIGGTGLKGLIKSDNNGSNWSNISNSVPLSSARHMSKDLNGDLYLISDEYNIKKSINDGSIWTDFSSVPNNEIGLNLLFTSNQIFLITTNSDSTIFKIYYSNKSNINWQNITSQFSSNTTFNELKYIDNKVFVCTSNGLFYYDTSTNNYTDTCNNVSGSLTQGLVGYWPFCGNANDDSGNGNNGTVNGATLTTDRFGNANSAFNFDGINDLISIPDSNTLSITNNITMSAWVYVNSDNQNYHSILSKRLNGNWSYNLSLSYYFGPGGSPTEVNKVFSGRRNNSGAQWEYKFSDEPIVFGQWFQITIKIENNVITFYKNGIDMGVNLYGNQFTIPMINQAIGLTLGSNGDGGEWFNGNLDDIGIWNRALTQEEITNLYNINQCITNITVTDTLIINVGQLFFNDPVTWANNITIAPNPASSQININFNNITNLNGGTLKIINSLGQEVATTPITTSGTNSTMQLATWGGTGMYFVQIINPQGQIVDIKKIILQ
jgi:hypothetical protein